MPIQEAPILLVEDNPMDVDLTVRAVRRRKLMSEIQVARDGEEALAYIERWDKGAQVPAVILLDVKLPRVDGLDVLRAIKAHSTYCTIPIVMLTSSAEDVDIQTAYQLGANSYIVKPVDFEKFMEVAQQIEVYWTVLNQPVP